MDPIKKLAQEIAKILAKDKKTSAYDSTAQVVRVEGDTAWVHIPGGIDETPVRKTIDVKTGDAVQIRVGGGKAWITGNQTAPPTDDTTAVKAQATAVKAVKAAADAGAIAGNTNQYFWHTEKGTDTGAHITEIPREDFLKSPSTGGGNLLARSNGIAVRDGLDELATFGSNGISLGATSGNNSNILIDSSTMKIRKGSTVYGRIDGNTTGSTRRLRMISGDSSATGYSQVALYETASLFEVYGSSAFAQLYLTPDAAGSSQQLHYGLFENIGGTAISDIQQSNGNIDIIASTTSLSGALAIGDPATSFVTSEHQIINEQMTGGNYKNGTTNITKAGYFPIAVSGWYSYARYTTVTRAYLSAQANGSGTISWGVSNWDSSAHTADCKVYVLWMKTA